MTVARDFVTHGIARLPEAGRKPNIVKYLSTYLRELTDQEQVIWEILDTFRDWYRVIPNDTHDFIFDTIGGLIGQPRPDGFDNEDYRFILIARTIARQSDATKASVLKMVDHLSQGQGYGVLASIPEHWTIYFQLTNLDAQWMKLYERLLYDTIASTDSMDLNLVTPGTLLYDDEFIGYDEGNYG
jgi:hypothetical protein